MTTVVKTRVRIKTQWVYIVKITDYIGRPWVNGQQDCWTLVRDIYRDYLAIDLPAIAIDADNLRQVLKAFEDDDNLSSWQPIPIPEHLCLVFFTPGHHRATHCGLWLDIMDGRFLKTG